MRLKERHNSATGPVPPSAIWAQYKVKQISLPIKDGPPLDIELDMSDGELCHAYH